MVWAKWFSCSGLSFFVGTAMVIAAACLSVRPRGRVLGPAYRLLLLLGAGLVLLSATPLAWWAYGLWGGLIVAWLAVQTRLHRRRPGAVWIFRGLVVAACLAAAGIELPWHLMPSVPLETDRPVFVIGDSLSAGPRAERFEHWPELLRAEHGLSVANLAVGGADLVDALEQARRVRGDRAVVLLEIGGNDLMGWGKGGDFAADLEALILAVRAPRRTLVMFELPSMPGRNDVGLAQRELSVRYGVVLIPKRLLAVVMTGAGNTQRDGIHLTATGHRRMAEQVRRLFRVGGDG